MSPSSSQERPALLVCPCPQHTELPAGQCWDLAPSPLSHHQLPIPGCSHSVLPALGHWERHWRAQIPKILENPTREPALLTRRFLTRRFPLPNEHKIFPCCQLLGSFVLLRAAVPQGKSPPGASLAPREQGEPGLGFLRAEHSPPPRTPTPPDPGSPSPATSPRPQRHSHGPSVTLMAAVGKQALPRIQTSLWGTWEKLWNPFFSCPTADNSLGSNLLVPLSSGTRDVPTSGHPRQVHPCSHHIPRKDSQLEPSPLAGIAAVTITKPFQQVGPRSRVPPTCAHKSWK